MSKIDITSYTPTETDKLFFDTNVWMRLFWPSGNSGKTTQKKYSDFLKKAMNNKSSIYISSMILSEFFNACLRLEFNIKKRNDPQVNDYKKDYRNTAECLSNMKLLETIYKNNFSICEKIDDNFSNIDLEKIFQNISNADFNDAYILELASQENLKIVSHDRDMINNSFSVPIITAL